MNPIPGATTRTSDRAACFPAGCDPGFGLAEFMMSVLLLVIVMASLFELMIRVERTAGYQGEVQGVVESTRIAMETAQRILRQAGNDPLGAGFPGIVILGDSAVSVRADITGSGPGSPDQGDPDGDTDDSGEQVTIRHNPAGRTFELVPAGGSAQPLASNITELRFEYFDGAGAPTAIGDEVRRIRITLTGAAPLPDPQTGQVFSMRLTSDVLLVLRR